MNFIKRYPVTIYSTIGAMLYVAGYFFDAAYDASGFEGFLFYVGLLFQIIMLPVAMVFSVVIDTIGLNVPADIIYVMIVVVGVALSLVIDYALFSPGRKKDQKEV